MSGRGAIKPPALPEKATIAVVAPASPPQTRSEIEQATAYFEARGHEVVFGPNHRKVHGYLAGTDAERAADLQWALSEPGIDMVHTLCGGYGTARLHDLIDWGAVGEPRIVCGFCDITALHLALAAHAGWVTLLRAQLPALHPAARTSLTDGDRGVVPSRLRAGAARAGCSRTPRTPTCCTVGGGAGRGAAGRRLPDPALRQHRDAVRGADRRLRADGRGPEHRCRTWSTRRSTTWCAPASSTASPASCSAPTSTSSTRRSPRAPESTLSIEEMLDELIAPLGIPAIANVPVGHGKHMATMPLGARARVDGDAKTLEVLEAGGAEPQNGRIVNGGA